MKMFGSSYWDSLFGTKSSDTILGKDGWDLINTGGGRDRIEAGGGSDLISGFSFDLNNIGKSENLRSYVDGGSGFDTMIIEMRAAGRLSRVDRIDPAMTLKSIEERIYSFGTTNDKQAIDGSKRSETIVVGGGTARVDGGSGNDYLFSSDGDDHLKGGAGNDLLSAGGGHNTLTGGGGADYFHFQLTTEYQYTEITDFKKGTDKIALFIDVTDSVLIAKNEYGDGVRLQNTAVDRYGYVDYDHGRYFDRSTFARSDNDYFIDNMIYEQKTGSFLQRVYLAGEEGGIEEHQVLLAHIKGNPNLTAEDFVFHVM